jgi:hypothetical protein
VALKMNAWGAEEDWSAPGEVERDGVGADGGAACGSSVVLSWGSGLEEPCCNGRAMFVSAVDVWVFCFMAVSAGLRVGSKFIILILGIHPSGVSSPPAFALRFLPREGGEEEDGEEEDMLLSCFEDATSRD